MLGMHSLPCGLLGAQEQALMVAVVPEEPPNRVTRIFVAEKSTRIARTQPEQRRKKCSFHEPEPPGKKSDMFLMGKVAEVLDPIGRAWRNPLIRGCDPDGSGASQRPPLSRFQTYIPGAQFVGTTWLCFLLPSHMVNDGFREFLEPPDPDRLPPLADPHSLSNALRGSAPF